MVDQTVGVGRIRVRSVDLLRGLVIVIMAIDHVRNYFGFTAFDPVDLTQTTPQLFFTRWITHFCAPVFVFLSGTSAWLYRDNRNASTRELARFLLTRGVWLIFIETVVVTFSWQFAYQVVIWQVIWAIGWSMICLSGLIFLPRWLMAAIALVMIFGHNTLDGIAPEAFGSLAWLWNILHVQGFIATPGLPIQGIFTAYPLIPWIGVMAAGYLFAEVLQQPPARRDRLLYGIGFGLTAAFLVLRGFNLYGDNGIAYAVADWGAEESRGGIYALMAFLDTTKYPPSLLFLLMTLGPAIAAMPQLERWGGRVAEAATVFGRVPFFFYVLHIPLIHLASMVWTGLAYGAWRVIFFLPNTWPADYTPNLLRVYAAWLAIVFVLYWPCRWFVGVRTRHRRWWLSYL